MIIRKTTCSDNCLTSFKIESTDRLLSLPLVKGTIQYEHILLHPRIIELVLKKRN